jgi:hypothetical protein
MGDGNGEKMSAYVCSSFGGQAAERLKAAEDHGLCMANQGATRKKLTESDIIFFSGHHYARYDQPLTFDAIDLNIIRFNAPQTRLLMISSCAGLRVNALHGFRRKFPNAYIFGWLDASPLNQKGMMTTFIESVDSKLDIRTPDGMQELIKKWRAYVESLATNKESIKPHGLGYATPDGKVTYYFNNKKKKVWEWKTSP